MEKSRLIRGHPAPASCRAIRELAGVSQEDVARELGVSREAVSRWETGERAPTGERLVAYALLIARLRKEVAS